MLRIEAKKRRDIRTCDLTLPPFPALPLPPTTIIPQVGLEPSGPPVPAQKHKTGSHFIKPHPDPAYQLYHHTDCEPGRVRSCNRTNPNRFKISNSPKYTKYNTNWIAAVQVSDQLKSRAVPGNASEHRRPLHHGSRRQLAGGPLPASGRRRSEFAGGDAFSGGNFGGGDAEEVFEVRQWRGKRQGLGFNVGWCRRPWSRSFSPGRIISTTITTTTEK